MKVKEGKTYIGVVEDNKDPDKLGRCKIRVFDVFDKTKIEDIPWASPWKDLAGNEFAVPENGKVVTVIFEGGNSNNPEFISSDHFNINLEKKLKDLNETDYLTMKSLMFDHKTQVYVNEGEGLKLDHKFNVINIRDTSINVNLKDNFAKINLGTANSTQRAILGDNFLNWFDDFVQILMGSKGGPFLGNLGAPVVATPALLGSLQLYQQLKDPKFLSKNVYIVDNENVEKLDRIAEGQKGDTWQSTVKDNTITSKEPVPFKPTPGSSNTTFEQPPAEQPPAATQSTPAQEEKPKPKPAENPDIPIVKQVLTNKSYKLYEEVEKINIVAVRNQCILPGDKYTDQFSDKLYVIWKKEDETWDLKQWKFSTVPGLEFTVTDSWLTEKNLKNVEPWTNSLGKKIYMKEYVKIAGQQNGDPILKDGLTVLAPSQYIDTYYISTFKGSKAMKIVPGATQLIWRDNDTSNVDTFNPQNLTKPEIIKPNDLVDNGIKIHCGYPGGINVGSWSEGSQVFSSADNLNQFFELCEKHKAKWGNVFTYTIVTKNDWDEAITDLDANKSSDTLSPTQSTVTQSTTQPSATQSAATQSTAQKAEESVKPEEIDVFGDGKFIVSVTTTGVIGSGKITKDDIQRIPAESITFTVKTEATPNTYRFFSGEADFKTPQYDIIGSAMSVTSKKAFFSFKDSLFDGVANDKLNGKYTVQLRLEVEDKSKPFGNAQKIKTLSKSVEFTVDGGSAQATPNTNQQQNSEFTIAVLNPTTEASRKVTGKITIESVGPKKKAVGVLSELPNNLKINPISTEPTLTNDPKALVDLMLQLLEEKIASDLSVKVKLVVVEKR
jgi:hypothetical protein